MPTITIDLIKTFRDLTGAPIDACKKALTAVDGDIELAKEELKRLGLSTTRTVVPEAGTIGFYESSTAYVFVVAKSETDFVSRNEDFMKAAYRAAESLAENRATHHQMKETFKEDTLAFRENCEIQRTVVLSKHTLGPAQACAYYIHHNYQRAAIVVYDLLSASGDQVAGTAQHTAGDRVAKQVVATSPKVVRREQLGADLLSQVEAELIEGERALGKPEAKIPQIVAGKLAKRMSEQVLLDQAMFDEPGKTVGNMCIAAGIAIDNFTNITV